MQRSLTAYGLLLADSIEETDFAIFPTAYLKPAGLLGTTHLPLPHRASALIRLVHKFTSRILYIACRGMIAGITPIPEHQTTDLMRDNSVSSFGCNTEMRSAIPVNTVALSACRDPACWRKQAGMVCRCRKAEHGLLASRYFGCQATLHCSVYRALLW